VISRAGYADVFGRSRTAPIPLGARVGNVVYAAHLTGADPDTGRLSGDLGAETDQALANLRLFVEQAGGSLDNVARVAAFVTRLEDREPFAQRWEAFFEPPRPACKVLVDALPDGARVALQALVVLGGTRERIDVPGVPARDPTVKIGDWALSSRVHGTDPATSELPDGVEEQAALAFSNVRGLLENAGRDVRDVSQITVFLRDLALAPVAERHFGSMFPEGASRPRLRLVEAFIPPKIQIMVEFIAAPAVFGSPAVEIYDPSFSRTRPVAIKLGKVIVAEQIRQPGGDFEPQFRNCLDGMRRILQEAGASLRNVAQVTVFFRSLDLKPTLNDVWSELYPDPNDRPPHKYVPVDLPAGVEALLSFVAVAGGERKVLEIPGMVHGDPMSMGAVVDGLLFSSRVVGTDTRTGSLGSGAEHQAEIAWQNVETLLAQAGAGPKALSQVTAFITGSENLRAMERPWRSAFPDASSAPQLDVIETNLPGNAYVRLEVKAAL
jgi:2-iminobutanoate/2-iminopropanoate deaminase